MLQNKELSLKQLLSSFKGKIGITWGLVGLENVLLALIPLFIGLAIDDLLAGNFDQLMGFGSVMIVLIFVAVGRRIYDTRAYGTIRVQLGDELQQRHAELPVSARNARLNMSRELVDFLEEQVPQILTALIQIIVAFFILAVFHIYLALSALGVTLAMIILYSFVHGRFYRFNASLNGQMEQQVSILELSQPREVLNHLLSLRKWEVKLSDTEAVLYGVIFIMVTVFLVYNLWFGTSLPEVTTGSIYSIVSYSWTYVESAIVLPYTLQSLTRLSEITERINSSSSDQD
ncbi:MAG: ABC transporter six-transmembrane domain-containing protein [Pseudomonadales bacterium]|nr:ABC transporter six-transmembrane domain-containing protein [Pseudomonadales bacterium]